MGHGTSQRKPAEDARRIRNVERGYTDCLISKVAGEPTCRQGEESEQTNCPVIGSFHCNREQCRIELGLVKHQCRVGGGGYRVETYMNAGPDSRRKLCCWWGHIKNRCGGKPKCGYCRGQHRTSDHKCNSVGFTSKQGELCGQTLEKCPNCKGNHIAFSS